MERGLSFAIIPQNQSQRNAFFSRRNSWRRAPTGNVQHTNAVVFALGEGYGLTRTQVSMIASFAMVRNNKDDFLPIRGNGPRPSGQDVHETTVVVARLRRKGRERSQHLVDAQGAHDTTSAFITLRSVPRSSRMVGDVCHLTRSTLPCLL